VRAVSEFPLTVAPGQERPIRFVVRTSSTQSGLYTYHVEVYYVLRPERAGGPKRRQPKGENPASAATERSSQASDGEAAASGASKSDSRGELWALTVALPVHVTP